MKIQDPRDHVNVRIGKIVRQHTPATIEVVRTQSGWEMREHLGFFRGTKVHARIRSTLTEINMPTQEVPDWIKTIANEIEQITKKEITVHLYRNNFLPF